MSKGSGIGEEILFAAVAKCNQLDPESVQALIAWPDSDFIAKTYRAIFKTFERQK
jgi:hypothetical protein